MDLGLSGSDLAESMFDAIGGNLFTLSCPMTSSVSSQTPAAAV